MYKKKHRKISGMFRGKFFYFYYLFITCDVYKFGNNDKVFKEIRNNV